MNVVLIQWSRVLLEKIVAELVKKFLVFCGTRKFVYYRGHRSLKLARIMIQLNLLHIVRRCIFKIHFDFSHILPSTLRSLNWYFLFRFTNIHYAFLSPPHVLHVSTFSSAMISL
jgi:hypothetical protein